MVYVAHDNQDEGDLLTGTRVCRTCNTRKGMTDFHWVNGMRHRSRSCKECWTSRARERRAADPEKYRLADRARALLAKYGITVKDYAAMWVRQGGECAICGTPLDENAHVDHDHATGVVRGLLCLGCNVGIGSFAESIERLWMAIHYLGDPPGVPEKEVA